MVLDVPVVFGLVVLLLLYLVGVRTAEAWPAWRTACFVVLGLGSIAASTMPFAHERQHHLWAVAVTLTLLLSISPLCLALGDPVGLARRALPAGGANWLDRILHSGPVRLLTFPAVAAVLATVVLAFVFFSSLLGRAVRHPDTMDGVYLLVISVGLLTALPTLGVDILPDWVTEPLLLVFAAVDGLFDATPGIAVMTTHATLAGGFYAVGGVDRYWDVHLAGAAMLALAEVVALPMFFIVFFRWAARETRAQPIDPDEPLLSKPWWEQ